jgi:ABC-2 type transport system permease protein
MSTPPAALLGADRAPGVLRTVLSRITALCLVELQRIRHDRWEVLIRAVQPTLWLVVFGGTFARLPGLPLDGVTYLQFLVPGILAQAALFTSIFYGVQLVWERDAGLLAKLVATPTPAVAVVAGKTFAAGIRALSQTAVVFAVALAIGAGLTANPLRLLGAVLVIVAGSALFSALSIVVAGLVRARDRVMGISQGLMMPLFLGSSALYPVAVMPVWLRWINHANPVGYQVEALRGLLVGTPARYPLDLGVLLLALIAALAAASALLGRLSR